MKTQRCPKIKQVNFFLIAVIFLVSGCRSSSEGSRSYAECILQHVSAGMSGPVLDSIEDACSERFPSHALPKGERESFLALLLSFDRWQAASGRDTNSPAGQEATKRFAQYVNSNFAGPVRDE